MLNSMRLSLAKKFARRPVVHTTDALITKLLPTHTLKRSIRTYTLKPRLPVNVRNIDLSINLKCKIDGFIPEVMPPKITGSKVKQLTKYDIKTHGMTKRNQINIWTATNQMQSMPIELYNKLRFQRNRPTLAKNESIIAWYWPIVESAVIKLVLNKQRGTLLVWYKIGSRHGKPRGLYLIRRLGLGEKPEWRWV